MKELLELNPYFYKYRRTLIPGSLLLVLSNVFLIWVPILIRITLDQIEQAGEMTDVAHTGTWAVLLSADMGLFLLKNTGLIIGSVLIYGLLLFATRQTLIVTSRRIEYDLRNRIFNHLQKLPKTFYDKIKSGDVYTRATEDVVRVREYFGPAFMYTINTLSRSAIIIAIMLMVNPKLTFWALLPLPFLAAMAYLVSKYINRRSNEIQQQYALMAGKVQEVFSSIRVIKAYNREEYESERFLRENTRYRRKKLRLDFIEALFHPILMLLIGSSIVLVVWQGGLMVIQGLVTLGNIAEFIVYVTYLTWPVASLGYTLNLMQRSAASNSRIQKLLKTSGEESIPVANEGSGKANGDNIRSSVPFGSMENAEISMENAEISPHSSVSDEIIGEEKESITFEKDIVYENVTFSYPGTDMQALHNINLKINAGEKIGIVGRTGSGKTTLIQLLTRIYDPQNGRILIDGKDVRSLPLSGLRALTGYVPQENFLFSDTIRENIAFGKENATESEIVKAAEQAEVLENILDFEKKFDTVLGERGITLSGGQKQRISIARALIRKPAILVLDDSLSAVDTKTEDAIIHRLESEMKNATLLIICHRLSSLNHVDRIIVMEDGRIVENGSYDELLSMDGRFAKMYRRQLLEQELEHL